MGESSSRFLLSKTFDEEKDVLSVPFTNLWFARTRMVLQFFENGETKERSRFAPLSQVDSTEAKTLAGCARVG